MSSLENRGNGSWRLTISDGYAPDGKKIRFQRTIHVDPMRTPAVQRREAEKQAALLEADFRRKLLLTGNRAPLKQVFAEFVEEKQRAGLKASSIRFYTNLFESRILPMLGDMAVQDIDRRTVSRFYAALAKAPARSNRSETGRLSGTVQHQYHTALSAVMGYAVRAGYIAVNPCSQVEPPRKDTPETKWLNPSDAARLLDVLDGLEDIQWKCFFYLSLYTGARPGELIALNWQDIDLEKSTIHIRASAEYVKGEGTVRTDRPKTKSSVRDILLPPDVMQIVNDHRRALLAYRLPFGKNWAEPDAVFTTDDGHRVNISTPTHVFRKLVKRYDLPPLTLYGLRHTAASLMIAEGLPIRDVAARLGHSQTSTTLDIYAHALIDSNSRATDAISRALEEARKA